MFHCRCFRPHGKIGKVVQIRIQKIHRLLALFRRILSKYFEENGVKTAQKQRRRAARHRRVGRYEGSFPAVFAPFSASEIKNIGLLGYKPRHFVGKTSALCPEKVRCFRLSIPCFSSFFPRFSPIFGKIRLETPHFLPVTTRPGALHLRFPPQKGPSRCGKGRHAVSPEFEGHAPLTL